MTLHEQLSIASAVVTETNTQTQNAQQHSECQMRQSQITACVISLTEWLT